MIASLAWTLEAILETSGAFLAFRKRLKLLSALLAWRAFADVLTFAIGLIWGGNAYGVALWVCLAVQYALLYALGVQLAAKMIQDYRPLTRYVYKLLAIGASVATYVFVSTQLWERKFAHAEAVTGFLLIAVVGVGWIGRKKNLEEPWKLITLGLIISAAGSASCAIIASYSAMGLKFYPLPALTALLLWNYCVLPRKKIKLVEFRGELPPRMPVESVGLTEEDEDFLKELRIQA